MISSSPLTMIVAINLHQPGQYCFELQSLRDNLLDKFNIEMVIVDSVKGLFKYGSIYIRLFYVEQLSQSVCQNIKLYLALQSERKAIPLLSFGLFKDLSAESKYCVMDQLSLSNYFEYRLGVEHCSHALVEAYSNLHQSNLDTSQRVAIVDDCPITTDQLKIIFDVKFKLINYRVFNSAEALVETIETEAAKFDLYIVDIVMGGMSGVDLVSYLRQHDCDAVIISTSQLQNPKIISEVMNAGADEFFPKPLNMTVLVLKVMAILTAYQNKKGK